MKKSRYATQNGALFGWVGIRQLVVVPDLRCGEGTPGVLRLQSRDSVGSGDVPVYTGRPGRSHRESRDPGVESRPRGSRPGVRRWSLPVTTERESHRPFTRTDLPSSCPDPSPPGRKHGATLGTSRLRGHHCGRGGDRTSEGGAPVHGSEAPDGDVVEEGPGPDLSGQVVRPPGLTPTPGPRRCRVRCRPPSPGPKGSTTRVLRDVDESESESLLRYLSRTTPEPVLRRIRGLGTLQPSTPRTDPSPPVSGSPEGCERDHDGALISWSRGVDVGRSGRREAPCPPDPPRGPSGSNRGGRWGGPWSDWGVAEEGDVMSCAVCNTVRSASCSVPG